MSIYSGNKKQTHNKQRSGQKTKPSLVEKKSEPKSKPDFVEETENISVPISIILPDVKEFYISFQNPEITDKEIDITDNEQKLIIPKSSVYKIFRLLRIPQSRMSPYILFSFTYVQSEIVTNTIKTYKIDYKKLLRLTDFFYIQLKKKNIEIEIAKKSMLKIFELLRLSINERLNIIQFFQVCEEKEKENEAEIDDDDIDTSPYKPKINKNLRSKKVYDSAKKGNKKNKNNK